MIWPEKTPQEMSIADENDSDGFSDSTFDDLMQGTPEKGFHKTHVEDRGCDDW